MAGRPDPIGATGNLEPLQRGGGALLDPHHTLRVASVEHHRRARRRADRQVALNAQKVENAIIVATQPRLVGQAVRAVRRHESMSLTAPSSIAAWSCAVVTLRVTSCVVKDAYYSQCEPPPALPALLAALRRALAWFA